MRQTTAFNSVSAAIGAAFFASAVSLPLEASAADHSFAARKLDSGDQLAGKDAEEKCGEG